MSMYFPTLSVDPTLEIKVNGNTDTLISYI